MKGSYYEVRNYIRFNVTGNVKSRVRGNVGFRLEAIRFTRLANR